MYIQLSLIVYRLKLIVSSNLLMRKYLVDENTFIIHVVFILSGSPRCLNPPHQYMYIIFSGQHSDILKILHFDEEIIITSRLTYVYARSKEN